MSGAAPAAPPAAIGTPEPRRIADLPGPRGLPLLGNAAQIWPRRAHIDFENWARRYGAFYRARLGPLTLLVVSDPAAIQAMLRDRPEGFRRPSHVERIAREMGTDIGLFLAENAEWRRMRTMVTAGFSARQLRAYFPSLRRVALRLRDRWARAAAAGAAIDLNADAKRYTVDVVAGLSFGADVNTLETNDDLIHPHLEFAMAMLYRRVILPFPYWRLFRLPADRRLARSLAVITEATNGFIQTARARLAADPARRADPANVLEAMILAADQPGSGLDDTAVAGNVIDLLLAGEITTSNTLAWLIYFLYRNPDNLRRATAEIRAAVPALGTLAIEQIDRLDFVEACANEAMRLKAVAPMLLGEALRDTVLGDVAVPAGTIVMGLPRVASLDEAHFVDAARFNPDRWCFGAAPGRAAKGVSAPFGGGPRICAGRYLALLEIKLAITVLLHSFEIESLDAGPGGIPSEEMTSVVGPSALTLRLRARAAET
jgi:cytochrome P450